MFTRCYDYEITPDIAQRCTPRQKRLLGDLSYDFRPGSYFYAPRDQVEVITGNVDTGESLLADTRPDSIPRSEAVLQ